MRYRDLLLSRRVLDLAARCRSGPEPARFRSRTATRARGRAGLRPARFAASCPLSEGGPVGPAAGDIRRWRAVAAGWWWRDRRGDVALAFLATPTDVFAVPAEAVTQAARAYATRSPASKLAAGTLRTLSGGRLLRRAYTPGAEPGINDSLVSQQGPNHALAKRLHRWRAIPQEGPTAISQRS